MEHAAVTLQQWRERQGMSYAELGRWLGLPDPRARVIAWRWCQHQRLPARSVIREIETLTRGAVTWRDWPDQPVRDLRA